MYEIFAGEYVTIVVKSIKGGDRGKIANLMLAGYLLEECPEFLYIGKAANEVFACIKRDEIASIMVGDPTEDDPSSVNSEGLQ